MAVRDSLEIYFNFRCKVSFKAYFSLKYLSIYHQTISDVLHKILY